MMAFHDGILYCANQKNIYLLDVKHSLKPGESKKVELDTAKQVRVITPGCNIQAVFNYGRGVIVAMETDDC